MRIHALAAAALLLSAAPAAAQGWQVAYPEVSDARFATMREMMIQQDLLGPMAAPLNEFFPMSRTVTLEMRECGEPGSYYDAARPAVGLCYELFDVLADRLMTDEAGEDGDAAFEGAFSYVLTHQVGHALIDLLQLPVGPDVEAAADRFVAVMLAYSPENAADVLAGVFALHEMRVEWEDAGALSDARGEQLVCLLYGGDPETHAWLEDDDVLDENEAAACVAEFERVEAELEAMLAAARQN